MEAMNQFHAGTVEDGVSATGAQAVPGMPRRIRYNAPARTTESSRIFTGRSNNSCRSPLENRFAESLVRGTGYL